MTITGTMLAARYKELDAQLTEARVRVSQILEEYEAAHTDSLELKAKHKILFAQAFIQQEGPVETRKQLSEASSQGTAIAEAVAKAKADVLREYLNAARDDVKCILQQMTNAQSVGAFAREEMKL